MAIMLLFIPLKDVEIDDFFFNAPVNAAVGAEMEVSISVLLLAGKLINGRDRTGCAIVP